MPDITVPVPDDRTADFYQFFGLWLAGDLALVTKTGLAEQSSTATASAPESLKRWTGSRDEMDDARTLWGKLSARGKGMFGLLMDAPGTRFTGREIAAAVDIPNAASGVAGVLAWPARFCIGMGRHLPTTWKEGEDGAESTYWIEPSVAELFKQVRTELAG